MTVHARDVLPSSTHGSAIVPDSQGVNLWRADPAFARILRLYLPANLFATLELQLDRLGALAGGELDRLAGIADHNPPVLQVRNRRGENLDSIEYHPAYRDMERLAFSEFGLAAMSHRSGVFGWPEPLPPAAKYALTFLFAQAEFGLLCPVNMTDSLARVLRRYGSPELVARYLPLLTSQDLDILQQGAMFLTEQSGGSDLSGISVTARRLADGAYSLTGEKWFCSNADAELALVLARIEGGSPGTKGLSLFLMPRTLPDGRRNALRILRLKDKLGTRSMASGEIRLDGAVAWLVGEPEQGMKQMAEMINSSRLSNGVRSAGMMRRAVHEALFVTRHREAFGQRLIDLPLMQRQLAKMLIRAEQARCMVFQAAEALRQADAGEEDARRLVRILTPLLKFRACRDARSVTGDAMEVRGGCGYIEEWPEPRLLRDAHLGSIWEGASNIVALDVVRAARKEGALEVLTRHVRGLLAEASLEDCPEALLRALSLFERARDDDALARSAASALYHVASAAVMAWEAKRTGDAHRAALARMVLRHRVLPRDPLDDDASEREALPAILAAA
jgi:acyl-CoA dehydrogenase